MAGCCAVPRRDPTRDASRNSASHRCGLSRIRSLTQEDQRAQHRDGAACPARAARRSRLAPVVPAHGRRRRRRRARRRARRVRRRRLRRGRSRRHGRGAQAERRRRSGDRQLRADARVHRGRLLRAGHRQRRDPRPQDRRPRQGIGEHEQRSRRGADRDRQEARRDAGDEADDGVRKVLDAGATTILRTAATVENLGAAAYLGQAGRIKSKEILAAALAIHTVEARHAAALNELVGRGFRGANQLEGSLPSGAFAAPMSMAQVLKRSSRSSHRDRPPPATGEQHHGEHAPGRPRAGGRRDRGHDPQRLPGAQRAGRRRRRRRIGAQPVHRPRPRAVGRRRRRDPQLRAHARAARDGVLREGDEQGPQPRLRRPRARARAARQRTGARRRADRDDQGPGRHARPGADGRLRRRLHEPPQVPEDRPVGRGPRRERLQRRRAADQRRQDPRRRRQHRPDRGAPRGAHPPHARPVPAPRAFDVALDKDKVLAAVKPFIRS